MLKYLVLHNFIYFDQIQFERRSEGGGGVYNRSLTK